MGYFSELQIKMGERANDAHLAPKLGISYTDLCQLDYEIDTNESDEGLIYNYIINFNKNNYKSILDKIKGLDSNLNVYIDPWDFNENDGYGFDFDEFEAITENNDYSKNFYKEIENINSLLTLEVDSENIKETLYRQIYISVISTLETYLSSSFINRTLDDEDNIQRFICTNPKFRDQKFELSEIYEKLDEIEDIAKEVMLNTLYHNLPTVRNMYRDTFNISFPNISDINKAVLIRHDLVHRNGFTKNGDLIELDKGKINGLINNVKDFVRKLVTELDK